MVVVRALRRGWLPTVAMAVIGVSAAAYFAYSMPDYYKSEATLQAVNSSELPSLGSLGIFNPVSALGIGGSGPSQGDVAVAFLRSRRLLIDFVAGHAVVVPLLAGRRWDAEKQQLILDPEIYDDRRKIWVGRLESGRPPKPTDDEIHDKLLDVMTVSKDATNGLIAITFESPSPRLATSWNTIIIDELNAAMRRRDVDDANRKIAYLNSELDKANILEVRQALQQLMVQQLNRKMFALYSSEYALRIIDPPSSPSFPAGPNRPLIVLAGLIFGTLLGMLLSLLLNFVRSSRTSGRPEHD